MLFQWTIRHIFTCCNRHTGLSPQRLATKLASIDNLLYSLPMEARTEIPPGTLIMLILKTLMRIGPMHGYGIAQHIQASSDDVLTVEEGSLYPALQKMLIKGKHPVNTTCSARMM